MFSPPFKPVVNVKESAYPKAERRSWASSRRPESHVPVWPAAVRKTKSASFQARCNSTFTKRRPMTCSCPGEGSATADGRFCYLDQRCRASEKGGGAMRHKESSEFPFPCNHGQTTARAAVTRYPFFDVSDVFFFCLGVRNFYEVLQASRRRNKYLIRFLEYLKIRKLELPTRVVFGDEVFEIFKKFS